MLKIDHVAIITPNLTTTAWQLHDAGLGSYDGGNNFVMEDGEFRPATAHRDVPLGNVQYVELEQFIDRRDASEVVEEWPRFIVDWRDRVVRDGPTMIMFWVITDDFDAHMRRLGLQEQRHRRVRTDGYVYSSRTAPRTIDAVAMGLPTWFDSSAPLEELPSSRPVDNPVEPQGIAWLEVGGDRDRMAEWLGPEVDDLPLRYLGGEPGVRGMGVALASGEVIEVRCGGALLDIRRS